MIYLFNNSAEIIESWEYFKKAISLYASEFHESSFSKDSLEVSTAIIRVYRKEGK